MAAAPPEPDRRSQRLRRFLDWLVRALTVALYCRWYGHAVTETYVRQADRRQGGYIRRSQCIRCRRGATTRWVPHIPVRMIVPPEPTPNRKD